MRTILTIICSLLISMLWAQKKTIDSIAYKTWPSLDYPMLSADGKYVFYDILNVPVGSKTLVLQKTDGTWKKEFIGGLVYARFSNNSKQLLFNKGSDSTGVFTINLNNLQYLANKGLYTEEEKVRNRWIISRSGNEKGKLVVKDLKTNKESAFLNVVQTRLLANRQKLLICLADKSKKGSLLWIDLGSGKVSKIWQGSELENLIVDETHAQLAFKCADSIWYYKFDKSGSICIASKNSKNMQANMLLGNIDRFSTDGRRLFFSTKVQEKADSIKSLAEIWNYKDIKLKSEFLLSTQMEYLSVLDIESGHINRLQYDNEQVVFPLGKNSSDTLVLVQKNMGSKESWSIASRVSWSLVSTKNGSRQLLDFMENKRIVVFSPTGKYLVYPADQNRGYCSYKIKDRMVNELTKGLSVVWADRYRDDLFADKDSNYPRDMTGIVWLDNDTGFLAFDRYDIWKLDPANRHEPVNITMGYGRQHGIVFSFAIRDYQEHGVDNNEKLYLNAFNVNTKENGFYSASLIKLRNPEKLTMGSYVFNTKSGYLYNPAGEGFEPTKAKDEEIYIVRRMSAQEAPNYFSTRDFKKFTTLSDLQPQQNFNWYSTQLHHWKSLDGRTLQGILYRPENFDPGKKYPIIFCYYERKSDGLNAYLKPEPLCGGCNIDIPAYVSRGYLVFTPDVYYEVGDPMQGAYNAVVSAANHMSSLPYVNAERMGIQGCSFGGLQTNYLVTHTNIFRAAVSTSSLADLVSHYGSIDGGDGSSMGSYYENGQARIGSNLWEKPDAYIKNSPVFQIHRVSTPLLIMHTKKDDVYPFSNIVEFFTGLRRMGKKVWMLVYADANHSLFGREAEDFSIKMQEFFDHYLKDQVAPAWMSGGNWELTKSNLDKNHLAQTQELGILTSASRKEADSLITLKPRTIMLK